MKKKGLILLLIATMLMSLMQFPVYSAGLSPYSIVPASAFDEEISLHTRANFSASATQVSAIWAGDYLGYKDMDFGKNGPNSVSVTAGASAGRATMVELRIDKPDGQLIASVPITQINFQTGVTNSVNINVRVTGVHDLYITYDNSTADLFNFCFYTEEPNKFTYKDFKINEAYSNLGNDKIGNAANLLWQLGIMRGEKGKNLDTNMPVSRAEFADAVYGIYAKRNSGSFDATDNAGVDTAFYDVTADNPYSTAISYLTGAGVINGFSSTEFKPHEYIKYVDAVTILVRMLGYAEIAEIKGGYPGSYLQIANELGLLSNDVEFNDFLRRGSLAVLLYAALHAEYTEIVGVYTPERIAYEPMKDVLEKTQNVYNGIGVVSATEISALNTPKSGISRGLVVIDGEIFNLGNTNANSLLGIECEYYYELENGDNKTLRAIAPTKKTEIIEISSVKDEIYEISNSEISYCMAGDKREETFEIEKNANVLYNGVAADDSIENLVEHEESFTGMIRIIQNGDESQTIMIDEYADYIIESVDYATNSITGSEGTGTVTFADSDLSVIYDVEMKDIVLGKLKSGDLITVFQSKNKTGNKFNRAYLSNNTVSGSITTVDENEIYIDDKPFYKSNNCKEPLKVDTEGVFRLNIYGLLVASGDAEHSAMNIGLFMAQNAYASGLSSKAQIKVMTTEGKVTVYDTAESVIIDSKRLKSMNEIINGSGSWVGLSNLKAETAIRYRLNANGEISLIDTPIASTNDGSYTNRLTCLNEDDTKRYGYYHSSGMVHSRTGNGPVSFHLPSDSLVFSFFGVDDREESCQVGSARTIINRSGYQIFGRFYSTEGKEKYSADLFVWEDSIEHLSYGAPFVVEKVTDGVDSNGNHIKILHGIEGAGKVSYTVHDNATTLAAATDSDDTKEEKKQKFKDIVANLRTGDILRLEIDLNKTVRAGELWLLRDAASTRSIGGNKAITPKLDKVTRVNGSSADLNNRVIFGEIVDRNEKYIAIDTGNGIEEVVNIESGTVTLVAKDSRGQYKLSSGLNSNNLVVGDAVFVYVNLGMTTSIIAYKDITF